MLLTLSELSIFPANMPVRAPPGALESAFRVFCMRAVRAYARGQTVKCDFTSENSKKCEYCVKLKEACVPVSALLYSIWFIADADRSRNTPRKSTTPSLTVTMPGATRILDRSRTMRCGRSRALRSWSPRS